MNLSSNDPFFKRLLAYLHERFPPVVYTVLVALFWMSSVFTSATLSQTDIPWLSAMVMPVVWGVFLHLRLFDEHKDAEIDRLAYPDRLLSRGVVDLPLLWRLALVVILLEGSLSALMGLKVLIVWGVTLLFTLAMRVEFGIGTWLNQHIFIYAITHNPVVACLGMLCWAATGHEWNPVFAGYLLMVSLASLAFELGRKIRQPEEELSGVDSYSSVFGRARSVWILRAVGILSTVVGGLLLWYLSKGVLSVFFGLGLLFQGCAIVCLVVFSRHDRPASTVEQGGSLFLLLQFLACIVGSFAS